MSVLSLRLSLPLYLTSLRRFSSCASVSVLPFSKLGPQRRLLLCRRGRASRYLNEDDDFYYDDDEEDEEEEEEEEEEDDDDDDEEVDLSDVDEELEFYDELLESDIKQGKKNQKKIPTKSSRGKKNKDNFLDDDDDDFDNDDVDDDDDDYEDIPKKKPKPKNHIASQDLVDLGSLSETKNISFSKRQFKILQDELNFDSRWYPLINYLSTFGLDATHFATMYDRHMQCFNTSLTSAREKLVLLTTIGVKSSDLKKVLVRQPQTLTYSIPNLYSHIEFLVSIGVPNEKLGQVIASAPSFFAYSIEKSLKPTIKYLIEEVGIKESEVGKVVQLSPQILVLRLEDSWKSRFFFFSKELDAPKFNVVKMLSKHPQFLHYSIQDGILPRINFLRSIGMRDQEILKVLTNLAQVLSLSLEGNLKPKYNYLINELRNEVKALTKYPTYLSLSLEQRIKPRHNFLVFLEKAPQEGPFPMGSLMQSDVSFCQQWAKTSVNDYFKFKENLLNGENFNSARTREQKRYFIKTAPPKKKLVREVVGSGYW